ncbi:MAG: BamA/TamA family outer membrane protein [Burkholderiales bacterium]|nr:BamA/TamA family outer membrane protein [Phycisphaerae bacterium]
MVLHFSARQAILFAALAAIYAGDAGQQPALAQQSTNIRDLSVAADLKGRTVEGVRVAGNQQVLTASILNVVRTREGDKFDPQTVQEDYQRIFGLRRFSNVEAKVEPTATGVIVIFQVSEQKQINQIIIKKRPSEISENDIRAVIEIEKGQAIDSFRIAQSRRQIAELYKAKNFPLAAVTVDLDAVNKTGDLVFDIVEGPQVRIRNITFTGNNNVTESKLKDQIRSRSYIWIFREGNFSPDTVEDDVASLRKYYQDKGFFDARVGRKLVYSADQTEMQIDFLIEEGPRYLVEKVTFKGNAAVNEAALRANLKLVEGMPYDSELIDRDVRKMVRDYSPLGFIFQPGATDPDYLKIDSKPVFRLEPGRVEVVYQIAEGKPFRIGQILPRGNTRTQDKVLIRDLRLSPGDLYDSGKIQDATERMRGLPLFTGVKITPVGEDPDARDLLVEVEEARTATFTFGAGVNSNGGVGGNITYTQKNFDITNWPRSLSDMRTDRSFVGAGQTLRISFEPGTTATNASIKFIEPWILDQPYSFTGEIYLRTRRREVYDDDRIGGRFSVGHRFTDIWTGSVGLRAESIDISNIVDKPVRAFEILEEQGAHTLTSLSFSVRRDTTTGGMLPAKGTTTQFTWESVGVLGGDYTFQKLNVAHDRYYTLYEDLIDRKTILSLHGDIGYIAGGAPFFERYYAGGINSVRGFAFRGISPRSGPDDDRIGGDFSVTGSAEVSFPLAEELLRGVVFSDVGMVEKDFEFGTLRSSVGVGLRITLPVLGQVPIAIDAAIPLTTDDKDDTQLISFSLGFTP